MHKQPLIMYVCSQHCCVLNNLSALPTIAPLSSGHAPKLVWPVACLPILPLIDQSEAPTLLGSDLVKFSAECCSSHPPSSTLLYTASATQYCYSVLLGQ